MAQRLYKTEILLRCRATGTHPTLAAVAGQVLKTLQRIAEKKDLLLCHATGTHPKLAAV